MNSSYIHGSSATERDRLALMNRLINRRCLQALELDGERRVLDLGCGTGQFTRCMAAALPPESVVVAVERDPDQLAAAREAAGGDEACSIDYRAGDALSPPLKDGEWCRFDLAHARYLLEHVPDPQAVVRNMVRAVRPGGRIVLLDDDHELMHFWPDSGKLSAAWEAFYRSYRKLGTDPLIGRRLTSLLHDAGARPSRTRLLHYGGCAGEAGFADVVNNLHGQLTGARDTVLASGEIGEAIYDGALAELQSLKSLPDAAVWYVINWAEGIRPA